MDLYDHDYKLFTASMAGASSRSLMIFNDIDVIEFGADSGNLNGQIFKMIRQWNRDSERGTVWAA